MYPLWSYVRSGLAFLRLWTVCPSFKSGFQKLLLPSFAADADRNRFQDMEPLFSLLSVCCLNPHQTSFPLQNIFPNSKFSFSCSTMSAAAKITILGFQTWACLVLAKRCCSQWKFAIRMMVRRGHFNRNLECLDQRVMCRIDLSQVVWRDFSLSYERMWLMGCVACNRPDVGSYYIPVRRNHLD